MLQSAQPQIGHSDSRPALRQPGSNAMPSHCSRASDRLRRHVAPNSGQLRHASLRSAVAQQIRAQPVAAPEVALPQVQPPRLPLGFSLATYPSLAGCNVLVTGSGRGIGFHTAELLALMGADVYITDLTSAAIAAAVASITSSGCSGTARAAPRMDLADLRSVAAFVQAFGRQLGGAPLHALVNNAGANFMGRAPWHTAAGVAGIPQVNVLGPFALTQQLRPLLRAAVAARVVNVASVMHRRAALPPNLDSFFTDWWEGGSYRNCKLAAVLLTAELQRRWQPDGVTAMAVDPGAAHSAIWAGSRTLGRPPGSWALSAAFAPPWDAAATSAHAVATADPHPAGYYARGTFASDAITAAATGAAATALAPLPLLDWPMRRVSGGSLCSGIAAVPVAPAAQDEALAAALWDACMQRAGLD